MSRVLRGGLVGALLGLVLVVSGGASTAAAAGSACSGSTCIDLGPYGALDTAYAANHTFGFQFTTDAPLATATLAVTFDRRLSLQPGSIWVDRSDHPVDASSTSDHGFTFDFPGGLAAGGHTVTFQALASVEPATPDDPDYVVDGALTFAVAGAPDATASHRITMPANGEVWTIQPEGKNLAGIDVLRDTPFVNGFTLTRADSRYVEHAELKFYVDSVDDLAVFEGERVLLGEDAPQVPCEKQPGELSGQPVELVVCSMPDFPVGVVSRKFVVSGVNRGSSSARLYSWAKATFGLSYEDSLDPSVTTDVRTVDRLELDGEIAPAQPTELVVGRPASFDVTVRNASTFAAQPALVISAIPIDESTTDPDITVQVDATEDDVIDAGPEGHVWLPQFAPLTSETVRVTLTARKANVHAALTLTDVTFVGSSPDAECSDETCSLLAGLELLSVVPPVLTHDDPHSAFTHPKVTALTDAHGNTLSGTPVLSSGDTLRVSLADFDSNASVSVTLHSTPRDLGTVKADSSGMLTYTLTVPNDLAAGEHSLVFTSGDSTTSVKFIVAEKTLASTGATPVRALAGGLGSAALGGGLLFAGRRRRKDSGR